MKEKLLLVSPPENGFLQGTVLLPSSKSISNRVLIIRELCRTSFPIENLSHADDTQILLQALAIAKSTQRAIDVGHAGTAMRFLTAYLATCDNHFVLTGSERMKKRPIGALVNALNSLGAKIDFLGEPGYPPLKIKGQKLKGGKITIDSGTSSQFISALLLIAPRFEKGLELTLTGIPVSSSYIKMTLSLMAYFGVESRWEGSTILIFPGQYLNLPITIESDWSGASYFYSALMLARGGEIFFPGLSPKSLQGDETLYRWFDELGVSTRFTSDGAIASKAGQSPDFFKIDFTDTPDMAQTMCMAFAASNLQAEFSGLITLPLKETDRINALQTEIIKLGYKLLHSGSGVWQLKKTQSNAIINDLCFDTHNDHRMAMACAPLALKYGQIAIRNPDVVKKSFPDFWENIAKVGFKTEFQPIL
ncbi:MAG TPA: hypothetical protein VLH61_11340 [Bacteroidales bacterium]|nr:hypothetical protein [Bacteroidales bacterium]